MRYGKRWVDGRKTWDYWPGKGLTLIEVMVIIAIMAILVGLMISVLSKIRDRAKEDAQKNKDGAIPVMPLQAEKSPVFPSGQEIVKVADDDLEGYLSKTKKRVISVNPLWESNLAPSYYLIVLEDPKER